MNVCTIVVWLIPNWNFFGLVIAILSFASFVSWCRRIYYSSSLSPTFFVDRSTFYILFVKYFICCAAQIPSVHSTVRSELRWWMKSEKKIKVKILCFPFDSNWLFGRIFNRIEHSSAAVSTSFGNHESLKLLDESEFNFIFLPYFIV